MRWNFRKQKINKNTDRTPAYKNPFFQKKSWKLSVIENFSFYSWIFIFFLLGLIYLLFYSPLLTITQVEIRGAGNNITMAVKQDILIPQLNQKVGGIFKQNNEILFSKKKLENSIKKIYNLKKIEIDKKFPHSLHIKLIEKEPALIWQTEQGYYLLDANGIISAKIESSPPQTNLKTLVDESNSEVKIGKQQISKEKLNFFINLLKSLSSLELVKIELYSTKSPGSFDISAKTKQGYKIIFSTKDDLNKQIDRLRRVLTESKSAQNVKEYINLRFGERVIIK